jgi:hypothetical protein
MAGAGSGPAGAGATGSRSGAHPGSADPAGLPSGGRAVPRAVPRAVLRAWDEAEARLFPTIMARPDVYQQSVGLIQELLGRLRETCGDLPALLAAHERGGDLVGELSPGAEAIQSDLVAAAACAMRYRELVASLAASGRLSALARARSEGRLWAVVEENGSEDRAPFVPYQRVEAEVGTGRAVIVSIEPDETLSRAVHRLDRGEIDLATGALLIGDPIGSYLDPEEFAAALREARPDFGGPGQGLRRTLTHQPRQSHFRREFRPSRASGQPVSVTPGFRRRA